MTEKNGQSSSNIDMDELRELLGNPAPVDGTQGPVDPETVKRTMDYYNQKCHEKTRKDAE